MCGARSVSDNVHFEVLQELLSRKIWLKIVLPTMLTAYSKFRNLSQVQFLCGRGSGEKRVLHDILLVLLTEVAWKMCFFLFSLLCSFGLGV